MQKNFWYTFSFIKSLPPPKKKKYSCENYPGPPKVMLNIPCPHLQLSGLHSLILNEQSLSTPQKPRCWPQKILLEQILIYSIRSPFVDYVKIFKVGTLNITPCCDKIIPWGHTIFRLVTHTKIIISKFQIKFDNSCGVSSATIFMIVVSEKFT